MIGWIQSHEDAILSYWGSRHKNLKVLHFPGQRGITKTQDNVPTFVSLKLVALESEVLQVFVSAHKSFQPIIHSFGQTEFVSA